MVHVDVLVPEDDGDPIVVAMAGEFDLANVETLRSHLRGIEPSRAVVLDLAETSYIDSTVLGVLAELYREGIRFSVRNAQPMVAKVLRVSGIAKLVA